MLFIYFRVLFEFYTTYRMTRCSFQKDFSLNSTPIPGRHCCWHVYTAPLNPFNSRDTTLYRNINYLEEYGILGWNAVYMEDSQTFRWKISPPSSVERAACFCCGFLLGLLIKTEGGGDMFLRNVRPYLNHIAYRPPYSPRRVNILKCNTEITLWAFLFEILNIFMRPRDRSGPKWSSLCIICWWPSTNNWPSSRRKSNMMQITITNLWDVTGSLADMH
jgi:hypothetical protein